MGRWAGRIFPPIFPAYAGVNLSDLEKELGKKNLPRVCGGEP